MVLWSWKTWRWPLYLFSFTGFLLILSQDPGISWTSDSFDAEMLRDPTFCQRTRREIMEMTRPRRPKQDMYFDGRTRPNITGWVGANRLLDGCWTYSERYRHYDSLPRLYKYQLACNQHYPHTRHARTAFVIRVAETQSWVDDFKRAVRAVIVELGWRRGMDVYILQHMDNHTTFDRQSVPTEFQPLTKQFTLADASIDYDASVSAPIKDPPKEIPLIAQYNHMAETFFMRQHSKYDFAWFSESDTRAMGPWDLYLNDIDASIAEVLPRPTPIDLLTLTPSYRADPSWPWGSSIAQFPNASITASLLQTHRISRAMSEAMHAQHFLGRNGYHELFVPTVATLTNMTKFIYANPVFSDSTPAFTGMPFSGIAEVIVNDASRLHMKNLWIGNTDKPVPGSKEPEKIFHGATYSPLDGFSERYYKQWMQNRKICRPISLVHPVKT